MTAPRDRSGYRPLSDHVAEAMPAVSRLPGSLALREAAAAVVLEVWPERVAGGEVDEADAIVNVAALAVVAGDRPRVLLLRPAAALVVRAISQTWPAPVERLPPLLEGPWIAEAAGWQSGASLFGDTWSLGSYGLGDGRWVVGLEGAGARVEAWTPALPGRPQDWPRTGSFAAGVLDYDRHARWAADAVAYAVALGEAVERGTIRQAVVREVSVGEGVVVVEGWDLPGAPRPQKRGEVRDARKRR